MTDEKLEQKGEQAKLHMALKDPDDWSTKGSISAIGLLGSRLADKMKDVYTHNFSRQGEKWWNFKSIVIRVILLMKSGKSQLMSLQYLT